MMQTATEYATNLKSPVARMQRRAITMQMPRTMTVPAWNLTSAVFVTVLASLKARAIVMAMDQLKDMIAMACA